MVKFVKVNGLSAVPWMRRLVRPFSSKGISTGAFCVGADGVSLRAVVALESTVITHGMPYPENVKTAVLLEDTIRHYGAIPKTIAVLDGDVKIGLTAEELDRLAMVNGAMKVSRRDLSHTIAKPVHGETLESKALWLRAGSIAVENVVKLTGGTTVSATMVLAHQSGISLFATGGIGGVHRDGQNSMDISADLTELGRTPVTVVCAGVKSILDIGRTLEYLETQGVCVATVGHSNDFPSFFSRQSGYFSPCHVRNEKEAAELIFAQEQLELESGILLAVPIPAEEEIPSERIETWLYEALLECKSKEIIGRDVTPYLLKRLNELSRGATLKANIALIKNNATMAAKIAVHLEALQNKSTARIPRVVKAPRERARIISSSSADANSPASVM